MNQVKAFQTTLHNSNEWVISLMTTYDYLDANKAFVLLRATLKALRDRIPANEAHHLGTQLPALIRGYYYEGWDPDKKPTKDKTQEDFLLSVRYHLGGHDDLDLGAAVPRALTVIFQKIDKGEADDVIHALPKKIQELCHE